jgi:hypothetical protein
MLRTTRRKLDAAIYVTVDALLSAVGTRSHQEGARGVRENDRTPRRAQSLAERANRQPSFRNI